ncbi:MAG: hypothetical protein GEU93_04785 [Propionibacteriales bacterium]|nr:hypothetical protein [Propionibacteriales bacterium]
MRWLVVGLGAMGGAFAQRLVATGYEVVGVDPLAGARDRAAALEGVTVVGSVAEAGPVERVLVIVRTSAQVLEVLDDLTHEIGGPRPVPVFVCSTLDPETARRLGAWDGDALRILEAPVTGLVEGVLAGRLTVMLAGEHTAADREVVIKAFGQRVVTFDEFGQPTLAKLLNNCLLSYNSHALAAVLRIAAAEGLPAARLMEVLEEGSGGSFAAANLFTSVGDLIDKDVGLLAGFVGSLPPVRPGVSPVEAEIGAARRLVMEGDAQDPVSRHESRPHPRHQMEERNR